MEAAFVEQMMASFVDSHEMLNAKPISQLTTTEYNEMLLGLVDGFIDGEGLTEVETCISDGSAEAKLAY